MDEDPLVTLHDGNLKLDGTEDDDDDEDDEVAQNKLLILVAQGVKTGTYAATCLREKGASECATSWSVSPLRRLGSRRAILQFDGDPSIVATFVQSVLRQSLASMPPMALLSLPCVK